VEAALRFHILLAIVFPKIGIPSNINKVIIQNQQENGTML